MIVFPQVFELLALLAFLALLLFITPRLLGSWSREAQRAEERANALLRGLLSEDERQHLERFGCLMVPSPTIPRRAYCIPAQPGMVAVYESGRLIMRLCLQPIDPLPRADMVLILKLMIEGNEEEYLRTANAQPAGARFA